MALPKYFTKITPFSKYLTVALFLLLPFIAFFLGIQYQVMVTPSYPPTQYIPPPQVKVVYQEPHYLTVTVTPAISCRPRPACLDANPHCMIAITADMCPPSAPPVQTHPLMQK
jgi:hypothetical protein